MFRNFPFKCSSYNRIRVNHKFRISIVLFVDTQVGSPLFGLQEEDLVCREVPHQSYVVLGVVLGLVGVVALAVLILNRSFFINKYLACKETMGSKHEFNAYSAKYSSVV